MTNKNSQSSSTTKAVPDLRSFKSFCAWLIYKDVFNHFFTQNPNNPPLDAATDVAYLKKDITFYKDFLDIESLKEEHIHAPLMSVKVKLSTDSFNHSSRGISLKQLNDLSTSFGTQEIHVSGDGYDFEYGEYTSGHDSEIILNIALDMPFLLKFYEPWLEQRKELKNNKKKRPKV